jgi:hypothetical protein
MAAGVGRRRGALNNLIFGNHDPARIAASVEEKVRRSIGAPAPVPYTLEDGGAGSANAASVLVDIANVLGSGRTTPLLTIVFEIPGPRTATLRARVDRQGVGGYVGSLLYSAGISKTVGGEVTIEGHKTFGTPKFLGDPGAAGRLNAVKDLAKRVDKLARTEADMVSIKLRAPRVFRITPQGGRALLVLHTLPRLTSMGMGAEVDAREFLQIADAIEAAL